MKEKLCYVMPRYDKEIGGHYYYNYRFIESLGEKLNLFLVVESSETEPELKNVVQTYVRKISRRYFPLNLIEMFLVLLYVRAKGYSTFYVHQSCGSAALSSVVTKIFGGKALQWHCGLRQDILRQLSISTRLITHLVTGTESMREYYVRTLGIKSEKVKIMPNWADLDRFDAKKYDKENLKKEMGIQKKQKVVLYVHALSRLKGAQHIPAIAESVLEEDPNTLFLIVGEGYLRKDLEDWVERKKLDDSIRILGQIPNVEMPKYFRVSDVFIMPSHQEGFPRVLLEAMAMGVPFVAHDIGGVRDIVPGECEPYLVELGDLGSFSSKIVELLVDGQARSELAKAELEHVKRYSKEAVMERFLQIIKGKNH